jgi:hypothetical protein
MNKKPRAPKFESLISPPWGDSPNNPDYGYPRYSEEKKHGPEHFKHDKVDEEGVERVVILGYN